MVEPLEPQSKIGKTLERLDKAQGPTLPVVTIPPPEPKSDELADFFDVGETEVTKPKQILADVQEAKKDSFTRKKEVDKAVADEENPQTKQGRGLGNLLVKDLTGEIESARVSLVLGEATAAHLQKADATDVDAVIKVLSGELRKLDSGTRDIFKNLSNEEATAVVGVQRRADQQRVTALKSTLLGMSEEAFKSGDLDRGLSALQAARVDMISAEPTWTVQTIAEAVRKADVEKPEVRAALVKILDSHVLTTTSDMEAKVAAKPLEELSGQEVVLKKGMEARSINQRIEAKEREAKLQTEYEERMKTAWERKMSQATADGKDSFKEHFEGGNSYGVRFKDYGEGSSQLADLMKDWKASDEVTADHRLGGVDGYLQVLENIMEIPRYLDKAVARGPERFYSDLDGKSKTEYEHAGKMPEWNEHIRKQILTEIYGNALGILQGAIEYEGRGMNEQLRAQILRKSLEVLGRGQALGGLIAGEGELTTEQAQVRKMLLEYIKNPIAGQEKWAEQDPALAQRRLLRLKSLKDVAPQADIAVVQRQEDAKKMARLKLEEEEKRRGAVKGQVGKSQEHLRIIDETKEKILDTQAKGARIQVLRDADTVKLEDYIKIDRKDKATPPTIDISIDGAKVKQVAQQVRELKEALEKDPHNRKLRDELAAREIDARFFAEMRDWVDRVNNQTYKRTFTESGLFKKPKGSILTAAFDTIPNPGPDVVWDNYQDEISDAIKLIDGTSQSHQKLKVKNLAELRQEVVSQAQAENALEIAAQISQTEKVLYERESEAKKAQTTLVQKADGSIVGLAKDFVKSRLEMQLRSERRLSYN